MDKHIKKLMELYFNDIPYSKEVVCAQTKIETALSREFEKLAETKSKDEALEALIAKYGKLTAMANLAGYNAGDVERWRAVGDAKDQKTVKAEIKKQRWKIYGVSFLSVATLTEFSWLIYDLFHAPLQAIFILVYMAVLSSGTIFIYKK